MERGLWSNWVKFTWKPTKRNIGPWKSNKEHIQPTPICLILPRFLHGFENYNVKQTFWHNFLWQPCKIKNDLSLTLKDSTKEMHTNKYKWTLPNAAISVFSVTRCKLVVKYDTWGRCEGKRWVKFYLSCFLSGFSLPLPHV